MRMGTESIKFLLMIYLLFYLYNFFEVQGYDEILLQAFWLYLHISQKKTFQNLSISTSGHIDSGTFHNCCSICSNSLMNYLRRKGQIKKYSLRSY